jgi:hypothetical protein
MPNCQSQASVRDPRAGSVDGSEEYGRHDASQRFTALLQGGLGNQMFQYAMARSLSLSRGAQLVLDTRAGFWLDSLYQRSFELGGLVPATATSGLGTSAKWLATRAICKAARHIGLGTQKSIERRLRYFREPCRKSYSPLPSSLEGSWTLVGYWQSPHYFSAHQELVSRELLPPDPSCTTLAALGHRLSETETVAIGYRVYEESRSPRVHASDGRLKSLRELAKQVHLLLRERPGCRCAFFCTHVPPDYHDSGLPADTEMIVPGRVIASPVEKLWLLSRCQHHIFSNSTFYWWGAWLSGYHGQAAERQQRILAANNFQNRDCVPSSWATF